MALIRRQDKGERLSIEEMDSNLTYLEDLALTSGATGPAGPTGPTGPSSNNYLVYTALITQVGTGSIPTANILQNTLGEITWGYVSPGVYTMNSDALFVAGKTYLNNQVLHINQESLAYLAILERADENTISLSTGFFMGGGDPVDSILLNHSLEVRVYL
jgi:hypothetical protein